MSEYKRGKIVKGTITGIENYGIFVSLDNFYSGLIHISEVSNEFVKSISDYGKVGETIYVKILDLDGNSNHAKLSIKDIDYRINNVKNVPIREIGSGFAQLNDKLKVWIEEKIREID